MPHRLTRKFLSYLSRKNAPRNYAHVSADDSGIKVDSGPPLPWDQITRIVAFKRDVYSHDMICLLIEAAGKAVLEVNEEMAGWTELLKEIEVRLPAAKPHSEWFMEVAFPAFAVSPTEIFVRR